MTLTEPTLPKPTLPELPDGYRWFLKPSGDEMYVSIQREVGITTRTWESEYNTLINPEYIATGLLNTAHKFKNHLAMQRILLQWSGIYDSKGAKLW